MKNLIKALILFTFVLFLLAGNIYPQNFIIHLKHYSLNLTSNEGGREIVRVNPYSIYSHWAIAGTVHSTPGTNGTDWILLKIDEWGFVICEKHFGFLENDSCFSITSLTSPGDRFILAGFYKWQFAPNQEAAWSMFDSNCNHIMTRKIRNLAGSNYRQVIKVPYSDFALTGYMKSQESMQLKDNIIATKYNVLGNMIWGFRYMINPLSNERAYSICFNPVDSTYAITGVTDVFRGNYPGTNDIFILKTDKNGIPIWFKVYKVNVTFTSEANKIIVLPDGYAVTGWTNASGAPNGDLWLLKTDFNGNVLWSRTWGQIGKEVGFTLQYYPSNNWIYYGGFENTTGSEDLLWGIVNNATGLGVGIPKVYINLNGNDRVYDIKLNYINATTISSVVSTGELHKVTGSSPHFDMFYSRVPANLSYLGCYSDHILATYELMPGIDSLPAIVFPIQDSVLSPQVNTTLPLLGDECIPIGIKEMEQPKIQGYDLKQNYPNPFNPITRIQYQIPEDANVIIEIYNVLGQKIYTLLNEYSRKGIYYIDFNGSNLSSGLYYCVMTSNNFRKSISILLLK